MRPSTPIMPDEDVLDENSSDLYTMASAFSIMARVAEGIVCFILASSGRIMATCRWTLAPRLFRADASSPPSGFLYAVTYGWSSRLCVK
eukprot:CAMPEP_0182586284 /NCGR_PEP_ID=MMETSP1324-20130603/62219_1 /TAXON_ID=236786 /ORGANISM="Florenciella sp., Strain RCC1587" /LENGTH=88 /DNA_ID=CAMNT_0024803159 /DNA_START=22 /DNA_END=285 /DNA_ORIENTATION=+